MIRRFTDFSFIDDESLQKIAKVVNNSRKLVKITNNEKVANTVKKQLRVQGFNTEVEQVNNEFYIYALARKKIALSNAKKSGQFEKIAFDRYKFTKASNPLLGTGAYDFDDGTIWKVITGKDGKDYLVKEVDDKDDNKIIRQPTKNKGNIVLASLNKNNSKQLVRLCKILYNNPDEDFINDLIKYASKSFTTLLASKLDNVIESELNYLNVSSPQRHQEVKENIMQAINNDQIFNRRQISNLILNQ